MNKTKLKCRKDHHAEQAFHIPETHKNDAYLFSLSCNCANWMVILEVEVEVSVNFNKPNRLMNGDQIRTFNISPSLDHSFQT